MTVSAYTGPNISTAAPGATVFPYNFKIAQPGDMQAQVNGVIKALGVDYTITGAGTDGGGNVTFLTPMVGGEMVALLRNMTIARTATDYQDNGDLLAPTLNNDVDAAVMMVQQIQEGNGRAMTNPIGSPASNVFPLPSGMQYPRWNAGGTALENAPAIYDLGNFLQSGIAAIVRAGTAKLAERVSVLDFYAPGSPNHGVAAANAIAYLNSVGGGMLDFPPLAGGYTVDDNQLVLTTATIYMRGNGNTINHIGSGGGNCITITAGVSATGPKHVVEGFVLKAQTPGNGTGIHVEDCSATVIKNVFSRDFDKHFAIRNQGAGAYSEQTTFIHCTYRGGNYGWHLSMNAGAAASMSTTAWIDCHGASTGAPGTHHCIHVDNGVSIYASTFVDTKVFPATANAVGVYFDGSATSARMDINIEDNATASGTVGWYLGPHATGTVAQMIGGDIRNVATDIVVDAGNPTLTYLITKGNYTGGLAKGINTNSALTLFDRIIDSTGTRGGNANVLSERRYTTAGAWEQRRNAPETLKNVAGTALQQFVSCSTGGVVTAADGDTTPTVAMVGNGVLISTNSGLTSYTNFTGGVEGQEFKFMPTNANARLIQGATLALNGSASRTLTAHTVCHFMLHGTVWYESAAAGVP